LHPKPQQVIQSIKTLRL